MNRNEKGVFEFAISQNNPFKNQSDAFSKRGSSSSKTTIDPNADDSEYDPYDSQRSTVRANFSEGFVKSAGNFPLAGFQRHPFQQIVKKVAKEVQLHDMQSIGMDVPPLEEYHSQFKFTRDALTTLHLSTEMFAIELFEGANLCTHHRGRLTLMDKDLRLARRLRSHTTEHFT